MVVRLWKPGCDSNLVVAGGGSSLVRRPLPTTKIGLGRRGPSQMRPGPPPSNAQWSNPATLLHHTPGTNRSCPSECDVYRTRHECRHAASPSYASANSHRVTGTHARICPLPCTFALTCTPPGSPNHATQSSTITGHFSCPLAGCSSCPQVRASGAGAHVSSSGLGHPRLKPPA